jgi:hypothetical protein
MTLDRRSWIDRFAAELGIGRLDDTEVDTILALAGEAAHASERSAAPLSCWLAAQAGLTPAEALERARALAAQVEVEAAPTQRP